MLIKEVDEDMSELVNFQFYFQPKDAKELQYLFRRDAFSYPSYLDANSELNRLNNMPTDDRFQTFLLDEENKVVLIGNPTNNPKVWDLYKQLIKGEKQEETSTGKEKVLTTIEVEQAAIEIENLEVNKTSIATFILKNTGENPLLISDVNASCGCTVPEWTKKPILPNESTEIIVQVTPDNKGYFRKVITVFCNIEKRTTTLTVKGVVTNN